MSLGMIYLRFIYGFKYVVISMEILISIGKQGYLNKNYYLEKIFNYLILKKLISRSTRAILSDCN